MNRTLQLEKSRSGLRAKRWMDKVRPTTGNKRPETGWDGQRALLASGHESGGFDHRVHEWVGSLAVTDLMSPGQMQERDAAVDAEPAGSSRDEGGSERPEGEGGGRPGWLRYQTSPSVGWRRLEEAR
jgi:hypothetical protein